MGSKEKNVHSANHRQVTILKHSYRLTTASIAECIYINTTGLQQVFWLET